MTKKAIVVVILTTIIYFIFGREKTPQDEALFTPPSRADIQNPRPTALSEAESKSLPSDSVGSHPEAPSEDLTSLSDAEKMRQENESIQHEFLSNAKIDFPFPQNLRYRSITIKDESIIGLNGESFDKTRGLTVLSSNNETLTKDILKFILENKQYIPRVSSSSINWSESSEKISYPTDSGVAFKELWIGKSSDSKIYAIASISRFDSKGSYLVIIDGPNVNLESNQSHFDQIKEGIKAR